MNQTQRKFLIEKIQEETKKRIDILNGTKKELPSASNYIFKAILNDTLELQPKEHILTILKERALKSKEGTNWLSDSRMGWGKEMAINFKRHDDILVLPPEYKRELDEIVNFNKSIELEVKSLKEYLNGIEMRIQLASNDTLKSLINEVDDLGDVKLIDTKVKLLNK